MMQIKEVPITEIKVKNRGRLDKGDIQGLAASIEEKGLIQPITIDQRSNLIAGERRLLAHQHLKKMTIPCIIRHITGVIDAVEVELIENTQRLNLHWAEKANLEKRIFDLKTSVDPGWSQRDQGSLLGTSQPAVNRRLQLAEAIQLIPELAEYKTEDEAWKEYKRLEEDVVRTHMHQQYLPHIKEVMERAGDHFRIGDAFKGMEAFDDATFNFAEVDTPYGVDLDKRKSRNDNSRLMEDYNEWTGEEYMRLFAATAKAVYRLLKPNSFAVFWYGMSWHSYVLPVLRESGFGVPDIPAVWIKGEAGQTASPNTTLGSCYEPFFLVRKGSPVLARPGRSNVFNFPKLAGTAKDHPTQKPLLLMRCILEVCLMPHSQIVIPFLGSGVTLRAAYKLGHTGLGWDLSQGYKNAFLRRIADDQKEGDEEEGEE